MRPHLRPGPRDTVFDRVGTLSPSTGTGRKFRPRVQPALGNWLAVAGVAGCPVCRPAVLSPHWGDERLRRSRAAARADGRSSAASPMRGMATTTGPIVTATKEAIPSGEGATAILVKSQP